MKNHMNDKMMRDLYGLANKTMRDLDAKVKSRTPLFPTVRLDKMERLGKMTSGLKPGVYMIAADTNSGKTAFLSSLMKDITESNPDCRTLYYSLDDQDWTLINRVLACAADIPMEEAVWQEFKTKENRAGYREHLKKLAQLQTSERALLLGLNSLEEITIPSDQESTFLERFQTLVKSFVSRGAPQHTVVLLDSVINMAMHDPTDPNDMTGRIAWTLKKLSAQHGIPIIATTEAYTEKGKAGLPRGSRKNMFSSEFVMNLRQATEEEQDILAQNVDGETEVIRVLETNKNKISGSGKISIPLAMRKASGQMRTIDVNLD